MTVSFTSVAADSDAIAELNAKIPANAFATREYFNARERNGDKAWILGLRDGSGVLVRGCGAFVRTGRLNRGLSIPSTPPLPASSPFWEGLRAFCRGQRITSLELDSFDAEAGMKIPQIGAQCTVRPRSEYVLDLIKDDVMSSLSPSHRKNVRRGQRAGLVMQRSRSDDAVRVQLALMGHSFDRRRSRGESVPAIELSNELQFLLESGAAEIFQAVLAGTVLSSVVVIRSSRGAYSYHAGTSSEGMKVSASHFLNYSIAMELRAEGIERYNLGGASENSGLAAYKEAFGARRVPLISVRAYLGANWRRRLTTALELYNTDPDGFRRALRGEHTRLLVYAARTSDVPPPEARVDLEFRSLSADDLQAIQSEHVSFRDRQIERLNRFGESHAFGVFASGKLAHISWLLRRDAMRKDPPNIIQARPDEAEITGCETLPEFRSQGIYRFAIANLVAILRSQDTRRVFMKTSADNKASQAGIQRAGLKLIGSAFMFVLPVARRTVIWRRFR